MAAALGETTNPKEDPVPQREAAPAGAPCWVELYVSDPDKAQDFCGPRFGWKGESAGEEFGGYINFLRDG